MVRRSIVRIGAILSVIGVLAIYTPVLDSVGLLLEGMLALVAGVPLLALGLLTLKRWWALLGLVGACVYGVSLMLPYPGRDGFAEQACQQWLSRDASPSRKAAIAANPEARWLADVEVEHSYLPAGWTCTYHPPGMAAVRLSPSWTGTALAASCVALAACGEFATRRRAR